jgi:alanine racemase
MNVTSAHFRPTRAEIDLAALAHNVTVVRALAPQQALCAVVKANAYGHGAVPMAQALQRLGIDSFGVAFVEEAVALRQAGIVQPILVWGSAYTNAFDTLLAHRLIPVLGHINQLIELAACAEAKKETLHVQVEVDTGMARLGVSMGDLQEFLAAAHTRRGGIQIDGIMSHLAVADRPASPFHAQQLRRIAELQVALQALGHAHTPLHLSNSPGAVTLSPTQAGTQMVRCGLLLYGMQPMLDRQTVPVRPVLSLHSSLVAVRRLPPNTPVSYGCRYITPQGPDRLIATVPMGYADGYRRDFSNRAEVLVRGTRVPVVGTVCMDMFMVDVTDLKEVGVGDAVVLMGDQDGASICAEELATWANTINYEIVCGLGARVRRCYLNG